MRSSVPGALKGLLLVLSLGSIIALPHSTFYNSIIKQSIKLPTNLVQLPGTFFGGGPFPFGISNGGGGREVPSHLVRLVANLKMNKIIKNIINSG